MKIQIVSAVSSLFFLSALTLVAEKLPCFDHVQLAKEADYVVLVSEGEVIDGEVTVLASYKGGVPVGSSLKIAELRTFAEESERRIEPLFVGGELRHKTVTCGLMILFLDSDGVNDALRPAWGDPKWNTWLCWIEQGVVYARWQEVNPGPVAIKEYGTGLDLELGGMLTEIMEASAKDKPQETTVE